MIRIWGGGLYQSEQVLTLLDEAGVMVWQDAMFSDAEYQVNPAFKAAVVKEMHDNARRMQPHPCIALYAGNNEIEGAYKPGSPDTKYYGELFFGTVLPAILDVDTSRPTQGSSPSNGNETLEHPVAANCRNQFYGDDHKYLYTVRSRIALHQLPIADVARHPALPTETMPSDSCLHRSPQTSQDDPWDVRIYDRPRFMSEFGLQSWPEMETMRRYLDEDQLFYYSAQMKRRNHHPNGV